MKKENIPKFFSLDVINIILTVVPFVAIFGFWNKLSDKEKIMHVICPFILIILIFNIGRYCYEVRKFYKKYEELYGNNQALAQNYKENVRRLEHEVYNNNLLREYTEKIVKLLIVYNDYTEEERNKLRKELILNFIKSDSMEGDNDEG